MTDGAAVAKAETEKPGWAQRVIVRANGLLEYGCEHGQGHPVPFSAERMAQSRGQLWLTWMVHGCDGCCLAEVA